jgi:hypothetical protein
MAITWLSVKRDFFIELSPVQMTRKFYLTTSRIFGGITHRQSWKFRSEVELATLAWVDWYKNRSLLER